MTFNYYYGAEADQFNFIKIPKTLIVDPMFESLSINAKLLYGVLLDRMCLSMKNQWFDEENRVYIIYKVEEIMSDFNFSKKTAVKYLKELEEFGLLEKRRRGLGLPSLLYVKSFIVSEDGPLNEKPVSKKVEKKETSRSVKSTPLRSVKSTPQEVDKDTLQEVTETTLQEVTESTPLEVTESTPLNNKTNSSNTNINNKKINQTDMSILSNLLLGKIKVEELDKENLTPGIKEILDGMREEKNNSEFDDYMRYIKQTIDYDALIERHYAEKSMIDGIVNLIVETIVCDNDYVVISSTKFKKEIVKSRFSKLTMSHIEYVLECMRHNTTDIKNIKKYLLAALYNAPNTIDSYYSAKVRHDMPQLAN